MKEIVNRLILFSREDIKKMAGGGAFTIPLASGDLSIGLDYAKAMANGATASKKYGVHGMTTKDAIIKELRGVRLKRAELARILHKNPQTIAFALSGLLKEKVVDVHKKSKRDVTYSLATSNEAHK